jgi:hypothetical protein
MNKETKKYPYHSLSMNDLEGEKWVSILGFEKRYKVSNLGRIKSCYANNSNGQRILKANPNHRGYLMVSLHDGRQSRTIVVHRIVATHFIENSQSKLEVNHKDAVKTNNAASNLEWCTRMENLQHSWGMGLQSQIGINNCNNKLSEKQVLLIYHSKKMVIELAKKYKVANGTISAIKRGIIWRRITGQSKKRLPHLTKDAIKDILYKRFTQKILSEKYSLSQSRISTMQSKLPKKYKHYGVVPK